MHGTAFVPNRLDAFRGERIRLECFHETRCFRGVIVTLTGCRVDMPVVAFTDLTCCRLDRPHLISLPKKRGMSSAVERLRRVLQLQPPTHTPFL